MDDRLSLLLWTLGGAFSFALVGGLFGGLAGWLTAGLKAGLGDAGEGGNGTGKDTLAKMGIRVPLTCY